MTHREAVDTLASERYLLDEMSELERYAFEEHFFACRECAEDVRSGERLRQHSKTVFAGGASAVLTRGARPPEAIAARAAWRPRIVLPWACAATVAMLLGYQSLLVVPELRRAQAPRALSPVVVRPASRGAEPLVTLGAGSPFAVLAVDVNAPDVGQAIAYQVTNESGSSVVSGTAPVPPAGTPLFLMIPARQLSAGTRYTLVLRSATSLSIGEYPFATAAAR